MSIFSATLSRASTRPLDPNSHIDLTDNTQPTQDDLLSDLDINELLPLALKRTSSWVNPARLKEELLKRKYAKFSEDRYVQDALRDALPDSLGGMGTVADMPRTGAAGEEAVPLDRTQTQASKGNRLNRGQQKIKDILNHRRRTRIQQENDTEVDVLYENQRGSWLFGTPLFSSKSLLNFDPAPWTNLSAGPSSVDITNAQLPDPSWEWLWKTWYVDMSLDVDEQGWQYNLLFNNNFAWHGTHPWFHSFVRRRRWIRKRARKNTLPMLAQLDHVSTKGTAHTQKLNADYFSVRAIAGGKDMESSAYDLSLNEVRSTNHSATQSRQTVIEDNVDNIQTLLQRLRRANVDREKIHLVLEYMERGGEDIRYLADEIPHIMSMFIFQHSRRALLKSMRRMVNERSIAYNGEVHEKGKQAEIIDDSGKTFQDSQLHTETDEERVARKHENLVRAIHIADSEIEHLEFWSDVRKTEDTAENLGTADNLEDRKLNPSPTQD